LAGPSTALAVATRFGIPNPIVARANAIIPKASRDRERLLEGLASERATAERLRRELEQDATEQRRLRLELEAERTEVRSSFQRHLEQEYRDLLGRIRVARTELDNVKQRLRALPTDRKVLSQLEQEIDAAAHTIAIGSPLAEAVRTNTPLQARTGAPLEALIPGMRVHVARLDMDAEVLEQPKKGVVRVRAGSVTLSVALSDIGRSTKGRGSIARTQTKSSDRKRAATQDVATTTHRNPPMRMSQNTLDLRGERVDAALDRVDAFVDELLRHGQDAGFILHGHGTGALKLAVREHVRGLRQVLECSAAAPEDGGDAFTLLWLGG